MTLQFLPARREALLVTVDPSGTPTPGDRCEHHAATTVLPPGWLRRDERPTAAVHPLSEPPRRVLDGTKSDPELDRLLDAESPLLRRAFRNTREA